MQVTKILRQLFFCVVVGTSLVGCVEQTASLTPLSTNTDNFEDDDAEIREIPAVGQNIIRLSEDEDGFASAVEVSDNEDIVLVVYNDATTASTKSSVYTFEVSADDEFREATVETSENVVVEEDQIAEITDETDEDLHQDITESFHLYLHEQDKNIKEEDMITENANDDMRFAVSPTKLGDQKSFSIVSPTDSREFIQFAATARYISDHFIFYVADADHNSLTDEELEDVATTFEPMVDWTFQKVGQTSDVNGNDKFVVVFSGQVNKWGHSKGGMITGFVHKHNLTTLQGSNREEVINVLVPDEDAKYGIKVNKEFALNYLYPNVLIHELSHLVMDNSKRFVQKSTLQESFLDEAFAHLMEGVTSVNADDYFEKAGSENISRFAYYLRSPESVDIFGGTSLNHRAASWAFLRHLYEQAELGYLPGAASGLEFLQNILHTPTVGMENLKEASLGMDYQDTDFAELIGRFGLTLYLSGSSAADESLAFHGLNLQGKQQDGRNTVLNGVKVQNISALPYTGSLSGTGVTYLQIPSQLLKENQIKVHSTQNSNFGVYMITR